MKDEPWRFDPSRRIQHLEGKIGRMKGEIERLHAERDEWKARAERAEANERRLRGVIAERNKADCYFDTGRCNVDEGRGE